MTLPSVVSTLSAVGGSRGVGLAARLVLTVAKTGSSITASSSPSSLCRFYSAVKSGDDSDSEQTVAGGGSTPSIANSQTAYRGDQPNPEQSSQSMEHEHRANLSESAANAKLSQVATAEAQQQPSNIDQERQQPNRKPSKMTPQLTRHKHPS